MISAVRSPRSARKGGRSAPSSSAPTFRHRVDRYALAVRDGVMVAGPLVRLACARHLRDRELAAQLGGHPRGLQFSERHATHAINFFERVLRLPDVADELGELRPFKLQPWQVFIVGSLFGWLRHDGVRRFRDAYIEVGKGNGKTPLAAGIGLYLLVMDNEPSAEIYSAGTTREQARYLWNDADRMVECSPELAALIHRSVGNLAYTEGGGFFRTVSSEHRGLDGKRAHGGLIDELHEHSTSFVANKIRANAKGRRQPLFVETTNSGFDRTSICYAHHEHSRRVLEGLVEDDSWFAYVCGLDPNDDPLTDRSSWSKPNPNLGISIREDYLERQVANARNISAEHDLVMRLNFCVWTQAITRFFDMAKWAECPSIPDEALVGRCYGGLDLGASDDFSAFMRVWVLADGRVGVRARFWLPRMTEGTVVDYSVIEAAVLADCRASGVRELAYDKRFAGQLAQNLAAAGVTCVDTPQGFGLNEAIKRTSELIVSGALCHGDNPILTWMAANAVGRFGRNGEVRLDKQAAREKIDGVMALVMAMSRAIVAPPPEPQFQLIVIGNGR
jgi:phage terminase large subunit-like protein